MPPVIDKEVCDNCLVCYSICPGDIFGIRKDKEVFVAYPEECWLCGACLKDCPKEAITLELWWKVASG